MTSFQINYYKLYFTIIKYKHFAVKEHIPFAITSHHKFVLFFPRISAKRNFSIRLISHLFDTEKHNVLKTTPFQ